jgi:hypothetical protein
MILREIPLSARHSEERSDEESLFLFLGFRAGYRNLPAEAAWQRRRACPP